MADKTITFSRSNIAQKDISEEDKPAYITQLSKPIILKGVSTKTCQNVLYSIDGMNFTEETTIGDDHVLSIAVVPFSISGNPDVIDLPAQTSQTILSKAFSYILGGRNINEDINISDAISKVSSPNYNSANGAYRYLLQYLSKNRNKIEWDTGDLFSALDADRQDLFGGSDFITDEISVVASYTNSDSLSISKQTDANGSILKPTIGMTNTALTSIITIKQTPYFFLYPDACPASDGEPDKLIIDNFWRGGGLLVSKRDNVNKSIFILYIFAVS